MAQHEEKSVNGGCLSLDEILMLPQAGAERDAFLDHLETCETCAGLFERAVVGPVAALVERVAPAAITPPGPDVDFWRKTQRAIAMAVLAAACVAALFISIPLTPLSPVTVQQPVTLSGHRVPWFDGPDGFEDWVWLTAGPEAEAIGGFISCPSLLDGPMACLQPEIEIPGIFDWAPGLEKTYLEVQL